MFTRFTPKGGDTVTSFETIMIMLTLGRLMVSFIRLVVEIVKNMKK